MPSAPSPSVTTQTGEVIPLTPGPVRQKFGGRPLGARNKRTEQFIDKALARTGGVSPLEVMLDNMIFFMDRAGDLRREIESLINSIGYFATNEEAAYLLERFNDMVGFRKNAQNAAEGAAPYIHPRLAVHTIMGDSSEDPVGVQMIKRVVVDPRNEDDGTVDSNT